MVEEVVCQGRLIRTMTSGRLALRSDDGVLPLESVMELQGFEPGDLLEVRLLGRCPDFGIQAWSQSTKRG